MRNRKPTSTKLFAHREDEAFKIIIRLEGLFARMFPSRGSRWLRQRLHRASAKLSELIILAAGEDDLDAIGVNVKPALPMCKIVDGMLQLLREYRVLDWRDYDESIKLVTRLLKVIARRFFGIESDDSDDGSSSPPTTSVSMTPPSMPKTDVAASAPPIFS
jgi:hypothetical protein